MESLTVTLISSFSILLLIAAATSYIGRFIKLPYTILLVIVGFLGSLLGDVGPAIFHPLSDIEINPDIILYACLPTLLFESAYNMDARLLRYNLIPVLALAIPGLFLSTAIIGTMVWLLSSLDIMTALLLGAILSATDPVAVISLFKQLGVPKRLTILVEGESLFNDSTAMVTAKTILFIIAAGTISGRTFIDGGYEFCWQFIGGTIVGYLIAKIAGYILTLFHSEHAIELAIVLLLVYLSFIVADEIFHVSGVMSTITAGIVMAGWGRTKISVVAAGQLHSILDVFAYIANSLIFLLVGFSVHLSVIAASAPLLGIVIIAMLLSRAAVIYGLIPLINKLPTTENIDLKYQTVMWWGGLRGAIALAIVLGLKDIPDQPILIATVMGAVLFTILVQGLSINHLIQKLQLNKPLIPDLFAKIEAGLSAERATLERIPELQRGGLFSQKIAERLRNQSDHSIKHYKEKLDELRRSEMGKREEKKLLYLSCFAAEKYLYYKMFSNAHLHEHTYRALIHDLDQKIDVMRYKGKLLESRPESILLKIYRQIITRLSHVSSETISKLINQLKIATTIHDYEEKWGLLQGCISVLNHLDEIASLESIDKDITEEVRASFKKWLGINKKYLDEVTEQFPEFVNSMQRRLGERLLLHTKRHVITDQVKNGLLPQGLADEIIHEYLLQLKQLRKATPDKLKLNPHELLRRVPFFMDIPKSEVESIIKLLKEYRASPGEVVIKEGDTGDHIYLILRGVVRVIKDINGEEVELATLMAGDFFGEMALLSDIKRTASCKAVTPCILYTLDRKDFETVKEEFPSIRRALEHAAASRK